ncbi:hypothetical protein DBV15_07206 [Temnothorax longispinosus]|uniref:Uncharacterized protein n=1 Tax=Temnothorax longispinosus TaxID=300112 RepID=A0A4S2JAE4_9HYME|nr:hypothetical protein DBV15_07206 [Temnothorax longispinosus]
MRSPSGLRKYANAFTFLGRRKIFKSCKLNRTGSVVTVCHESDMADNGVPQLLSVRVSRPHSPILPGNAGAIFEQGTDEVQSAFKFAMMNHNQNITIRKFELLAFVDVINTADAYKLSRLSEYRVQTYTFSV